ncbi:hypothetical protein M5689_007441 [Euphorbia peplus]|nr:hypothetical protein M5689_007441 [Euphorbia peplus]
MNCKCRAAMLVQSNTTDTVEMIAGDYLELEILIDSPFVRMLDGTPKKSKGKDANNQHTTVYHCKKPGCVFV